MRRRVNLSLAISVCSAAIFTGGLAEGADSYNPATSVLTIPQVRIAGSTTVYVNVVLGLGSSKVISSGSPSTLPAIDTFVPSTNRLSIPLMTSGGGSYGNILLELAPDARVISIGGTTVQTSPAPITVLPSSYENKMLGASLGSQPLPQEVLVSNSVAFADFFQDGSLSMVTHTLDYSASDPSTATRFGKVHFYRNSGGRWVDSTSLLLAQTTGCLHPRKTLVADFNGDSRPDVFFACHGFDGGSFPGEQPVLLMSQPDGAYTLSKVPVTGFFHGASAADVNGDGYPDLLLVDFIGGNCFLINNKDGSFSRDFTRLSASVRAKVYFSAELIDVSGRGRYDAFMAGSEMEGPNPSPATLYPNDGAGRFSSTTPVVLPAPTGYGYALDVLFVNGAFYLARTTDASANWYNGTALQKVSYPSLASQVLLQTLRPESCPAGQFCKSWINWIIPYLGRIVPMDSRYNVSVPQ
jgi:hypothetical protein